MATGPVSSASRKMYPLRALQMGSAGLLAQAPPCTVLGRLSLALTTEKRQEQCTASLGPQWGASVAPMYRLTWPRPSPSPWGYRISCLNVQVCMRGVNWQGKGGVQRHGRVPREAAFGSGETVYAVT